MRTSKLNDYKKMDEKALLAELKELKQELFKLRFSHAMNGLDNPHKIVETKKNIARVNTILAIKSHGGVIVVKEEKEKTPKAKAKKETKKVESTEKAHEPEAKKTTKKVAKKEVGGKD